METSRLTSNSIIRSASSRLCWSSFIVLVNHHHYRCISLLCQRCINFRASSCQPTIIHQLTHPSLMCSQPTQSTHFFVASYLLVITKLSRPTITIVLLCFHRSSESLLSTVFVPPKGLHRISRQLSTHLRPYLPPQYITTFRGRLHLLHTAIHSPLRPYHFPLCTIFQRANCIIRRSCDSPPLRRDS